MPRLRRKIRGPSKDVVVKRVGARLRAGQALGHMSIAVRAQLEGAKIGLLARERSRLAAKLGPRSPEVERIERALRVQEGMAARLRSDAERARIVQPRPDKETVVIHGRALDPKRAGVAKIDVALLDREGKRLAHGRTNDKGYFKLERRVQPNQPGDRDSIVVVLSRGNDELHRRPVGDLLPGEVGYGEFLVKP